MGWRSCKSAMCVAMQEVDDTLESGAIDAAQILLDHAMKGFHATEDAREAENKKLRTENQTLQEALAHWQGVVRVAREKDSTLPNPESPSVP